MAKNGILRGTSAIALLLQNGPSEEENAIAVPATSPCPKSWRRVTSRPWGSWVDRLMGSSSQQVGGQRTQEHRTRLLERISRADAVRDGVVELVLHDLLDVGL